MFAFSRKKKIVLYTVVFIALLFFLSRCVLFQMRWSDSKSQRVFNSKNIRLAVHDTLIEGHHIHYTVTGNDSLPTLVFIHGSPGSWFHYMRFMWDTALLKKYRMISFDRPGYGKSEYGKAMHLQGQCRLLLPVLQQLKNNRPMIAHGHSYGGPVVAKLAADDPSLFKMIIINAGALDPALETKETWRQIIDKKPFYWFVPGAFQQSNTELLFLKEDLRTLANDLSAIRCKVLFVHGDHDTWVPIENIAYGEKMMVNAATIAADTVWGADHQIPWKRSAEFKKILMDLPQ